MSAYLSSMVQASVLSGCHCAHRALYMQPALRLVPSLFQHLRSLLRTLHPLCLQGVLAELQDAGCLEVSWRSMHSMHSTTAETAAGEAACSANSSAVWVNRQPCLLILAQSHCLGPS